jgi:PST family polysaccharide transporter
VQAIQSSPPIAAPRRSSPRPRLRARLPGREGAFWVLLALAVPRIVGTAFTIVLRRFLGPGAAGLFDSAAVPYRLLDNFRAFGTGPALVYEREVNADVADTAWTLNILFAVTVTILAQLLAHPIALYYGHPQIEGIVRILSIGYIFASISSVHSFLLMRDLNFRTRALPAVGQTIAGGSVAVLVAIWGFGAGALAMRELTSVIAGAILLRAVYPLRPRLRLVPGIAAKLLRYGAWIGSGLAILYMSQNADIFIGGRIIHTAADIGFYTTSWNLAFVAAGICTLVASSMVFPSLSRVRHDPDLLRQKLLVGVRQVGLIMLPAATFLALVAPVIIVPILGHKWAAYRADYVVLSLLAIYSGNRAMMAIFFEGYKSVGKPWIITVYHGIKLALIVPAMIYGAEHGILGLALTYIPIQILEIPVALFLARRVLGLTPPTIWKALRTPIGATLLMGAAVVAVEIGLHHALHRGDLLTLLACVLTGITVYLTALRLLERGILTEARSFLVRGL